LDRQIAIKMSVEDANFPVYALGDLRRHDGLRADLPPPGKG
jgi:hypothetical protein